MDMKRIVGPKSQKQFEFEFLASPKAVVILIEAINAIDSNMLANLRIHDLDKVCCLAVCLINKKKTLMDEFLLNVEAALEKCRPWTSWLFKRAAKDRRGRGQNESSLKHENIPFGVGKWQKFRYVGCRVWIFVLIL
jgi:hypothetical protein